MQLNKFRDVVQIDRSCCNRQPEQEQTRFLLSEEFLSRSDSCRVVDPNHSYISARIRLMGLGSDVSWGSDRFFSDVFSRLVSSA